MTQDDIFLPYDRYTRLTAALANLEPCPFEGRITEDQIKRVLGEAGDIWPLEIRGDVIIAQLEDTEKKKRN
ncbi:hypothetical protein [Bradyrhizobium sp. SZCCHNR2032]|uniref:hypothetical protein n=1 Tax=Bradyrhizobium sp. SZCCHNR2032 TaxID=3057384 RepID=UPI002915E473|nr:hypothetical protein [Bradyrhizobium sp. SZCCHNR2032]